jgi:hypothetical protein
VEADVALLDRVSALSLIAAGTDLAGLCMLTGVLAVSAWYCLSPPPTLRHAAPSAAQRHGILLALCGLAAPLLLFASLAGALALAQQAGAGMALPPSHPARLLVWGLYAAIGLAQLFALQRLAYWPAPRLHRLLPLTASALLLLPLATGVALLALEHRFLAPGSMPRMAVVAAAGAAVSGILLWLPVQLRSCVSVDAGPARTEPVMASAEPAATPQPAIDSAAADSNAARSAAQEMERRLQEISAMLEQEQTAAEQKQRAQDEILYASAMRQQVNSQKFLFESGLPCNLAMLANGLIILDLPLDIHDHVRGDTLLHAAVREGNVALVRQLLDHGVSVSAPNWAGLSARAGVQDAEIQALLDAAETTAR